MRSPGKINLLGLTDAGMEWLNRPIELPDMGNAIVHYSGKVKDAFGLTSAEALITVLVGKSLAVGPSCAVIDPFGQRKPLSLQLVIQDGAHGHFGLAARAMLGATVEVFAETIGRHAITAEQLQAFLRKASGQTDPKWVDNEVCMPDEMREEKMHRHGNVYSRKMNVFPFGPAVDASLVKGILLEMAEVSFGVCSGPGTFPGLLGKDCDGRRAVESFVNAGWSGDSLPAVDQHPVFPVVAGVWLANEPEVDTAWQKGLFSRIPGLLLAVGEEGSNPPDAKPEVLASWRKYVRAVLEKRLACPSRHTAPGLVPFRELSLAAAEKFTATMRFAREFASDDAFATQFFKAAPLQILKMAALLSSKEINEAEVAIACELFRWLARGTLFSRPMETTFPPPVVGEEFLVQRVLEKLAKHGPVTMRELARKFHRMNAKELTTAIQLAERQGAVQVKDDKIHL